MGVVVGRVDGGHRLVGDGPLTVLANRWLAHLEARCFSPATVRGYAFDLLNLSRFFEEKGVGMSDVGATDFFEWLDWQARPVPSSGRRVVRLSERRGASPATMNRRIAAARGLFEFAVVCGERETNPVPSPRRSAGVRSPRRGLLGHVEGRRAPVARRLVRQDQRLPESLAAEEVGAFLADLDTHRDRAVVLLMLLGGLRAAEVRTLRLADVDMGMRQVRVRGKGNKLRTPECFVVLRGPTTGGPMTEAGLRRIFRTHRARSGASRVRPHRLRHTFGTELAAAGMDLLVLRELMGHVHAETTAAYVHPSLETVAAEWHRAREAQR
jgi:site-specific recombinase XerD